MHEMIVRQQLAPFWITKKVFISEQFGFLKVKSCISQLLSLFHDWARQRNKGLKTDAIFLHLSKAFDLVRHKRGIQGPLTSYKSTVSLVPFAAVTRVVTQCFSPPSTGVSLRARHQANRLALRMILHTWFNHLVESFSNK